MKPRDDDAATVSVGLEPWPLVALLVLLTIGLGQGRWFTLPIERSLLYLILGGTAALIVAWQAWRLGRQSAPARQPDRPSETASDGYVPSPVVPRERFSDVCGLETVKEEIADILQALREPSSYTQVGARFPAGVLLSGPPGTGKTLISRALAGESGVSFFSCSGSEFVEVYAGLGATRIRRLFAAAREAAPAIVLIDEFDSLGSARAYDGSASGERAQTVNELLLQMNELGTASKPIVVIAATNRPDGLDGALLRRGRFDRRIEIEVPDRSTRRKILDHFCGRIRTAQKVDTELLASQTAGFTGADLEALVNDAAVLAARERAAAVGAHHLAEAVDRSLLGVSQNLVSLSGKERHRLAAHESGHAVALLASGEPHLFPHKVSILARQRSAAYNLVIRREEQAALSSEHLELEIVMLLSGRAAERLVFGSISTLCKEDLARATHLARAMVTEFGMSPAFGPLSAAQLGGSAGDETREIRRILVELDERATELIERHRPALERISRELLATETVEGERLVELFEGA